MGVIALVLLSTVAAPSVARAQDVPAAFDAPWTDVAPHVEDERVVAAALGMGDERMARLAPRRAAARRAGEERARAMIHRWADDALARIAASPTIAASVHRTIDEAAMVSRVRPLSDGSAVVEIAVPLATLRAVIVHRGLPW